MYEPFAASLARRLTTRDATSALPAAPVLAETSPRPRRTVDLRGLAARRLVRLAGRLDPSVGVPC
jgi:hypothetical protein